MADVKVYDFQFEEKRFVPHEDVPTNSTKVSKISFFKRVMNFLSQENQSISIDSKLAQVYSTIHPSIGFNFNR